MSGVRGRLQRFVEGETARTIYRLPPSGRLDPLREDIAALLAELRPQDDDEPELAAHRHKPNPEARAAVLRRIDETDFDAMSGDEWSHWINGLPKDEFIELVSMDFSR